MNRRTLYLFIPFSLLLLFLAIINLAPRFPTAAAIIPEQPAVTVPNTSSLKQPTAASLIIPIPQPSVTPSPQPTITPSPLPPEATITLLGPPLNGRYQPSDRINFYWQWPLPLTEEQQFSLVWLVDGEVRSLGTLTEPNLGLNYRLTATAPGNVNNVTWQMRLELISTGESLVVSEERPLLILTK
ncbi:MAG: hypothetical protein GY796_34110 [Chloroflexi bacterium]|nr:hypothetical protein [Chloroflexota bacterium]